MESGWPGDLPPHRARDAARGSGASACEIPRARLYVELGRRRHRRLTLPSGVLLLVCLFLPAVDGCGQEVYPIEMPYFWHPYVYGGALALCALAATVRGVRQASFALRILAWIALVGGFAMTTLSVGVGVVETVLGGVLLAVIGTQGASEKRIALTAIVISVLSLLWFGLWAGSSGALIGVYLSLGASICLLAGSLLWLTEI